MDENAPDFLDAIWKLLEPSKLQTYPKSLIELEAVRPALLRLRTQLQREVWEKREQYRMPNYPPDPKDKATPRYTDFDRRTMLDAQMAELQTKYELVRGIEDLVKERINFILNVNQEKDG